MLTSDANVVVALVDVLLVSFTADQMRCVAFTFGENFNVVNFHHVFEAFRVSP